VYASFWLAHEYSLRKVNKIQPDPTMLSSARFSRNVGRGFAAAQNYLNGVATYSASNHAGACWRWPNARLTKQLYVLDCRTVRRSFSFVSYKCCKHAGLDDSEMSKTAFLASCYNELMANARHLTADEWETFGAKFEKTYIKSRWPTVMLSYIIGITDSRPGLYELGMSLIEYAASCGSKDRSYLLLATVAICVHQGGSSHVANAYTAYEELSSLIDCFDSTSAQILINALSKTARWRECLKLIEMAKFSRDVTGFHYSPVLVAALQHGEHQFVDDTMHYMFSNGMTPTDSVYSTMLDLGLCDQLLNVLKKFRWIPSKQTAGRIATYFERQVLIQH
jgi:hypothetical protein